MTYDELMALYTQALNTPGGIIDPDAQNFQLPDGSFAAWNGNGFTLANGDARSGGIQRYGVTPQGTSDMGFEAIDRDGKFRDNLLKMGLAAGGVLGAGALAGGLGAAGGAAAAAPAAAPAAGSLTMEGILGSTFGTGGGTALSGFGAVPAASMFGAPTSLSGLGSMASAALPAAASALGSGGGGGGSGGTDWSQLLGGAGGAALLGGLAGVAGNSDIQNSQNTVGSTAQSGTTSQSGSSSTGLAPWLQGYAQDYLGRAQGLLNQGTSNPMTQQAGGLLTQYATQGSPVVNAAMQQQQDVIGGKYLGPNPYLDQYAKGISDRMGEAYATGTRAGVFSGFNNDGNSVLSKSGFGQTLGNTDRAFGDALGQTMSGLYMNNYQTERANQNAAAQSAPNLANFGVNTASLLGQFGTQQQMLPWQQLGMYGQAINPAFGSQSSSSLLGNQSQTGTANQTQTQNIQGPSNVLAGLGGAMAGAGLYRSILGGR